MTNKELKDLVGTDVVLVPVSNNVSRNTPIQEQFITTELLRVRGERATVKVLSKSFNANGELDRYNCGYKLYASEQQALNSLKQSPLLKLQYFDYGVMSLEDYNTLSTIVEKYTT